MTPPQNDRWSGYMFRAHVFICTEVDIAILKRRRHQSRLDLSLTLSVSLSYLYIVRNRLYGIGDFSAGDVRPFVCRSCFLIPLFYQ